MKVLARHYTFFFSRYYVHPHLHSFPTRRSSDLHDRRNERSGERNRRSRRTNRDANNGCEQPAQNQDREIQLLDRKSTRLNSSHLVISYAVFCLKKKKINIVKDIR